MDKLLAALNIEQAAAPGIMLLLGIIKAHINASHGVFPTEEEMLAAVPIDVQTLRDLWSKWTAVKGA